MANRRRGNQEGAHHQGSGVEDSLRRLTVLEEHLRFTTLLQRSPPGMIRAGDAAAEDVAEERLALELGTQLALELGLDAEGAPSREG